MGVEPESNIREWRGFHSENESTKSGVFELMSTRESDIGDINFGFGGETPLPMVMWLALPIAPSFLNSTHPTLQHDSVLHIFPLPVLREWRSRLFGPPTPKIQAIKKAIPRTRQITQMEF